MAYRFYRSRPILNLGYSDERRQAPIEGTYLPSCLYTDGRSAAQLVGSFVTNASSKPSKVVSKAPVVVGKSVDSVTPVT
jgi:hypothetical protein